MGMNAMHLAMFTSASIVTMHPARDEPPAIGQHELDLSMSEVDRRGKRPRCAKGMINEPRKMMHGQTGLKEALQNIDMPLPRRLLGQSDQAKEFQASLAFEQGKIKMTANEKGGQLLHRSKEIDLAERRNLRIGFDRSTLFGPPMSTLQATSVPFLPKVQKKICKQKKAAATTKAMTASRKPFSLEEYQHLSAEERRILQSYGSILQQQSTNQIDGNGEEEDDDDSDIDENLQQAQQALAQIIH